MEAGHGAVWKPAVIHTRASWSSDVVEVECDGVRRVVHVATMRDGRWVPHTMECVFGDTLEEQGWVIADLLTHGLGAHMQQLAAAVVAVLSAGSFEAAVGVEPYSWPIAQVLVDSGRAARAVEVTRLQDAVQSYVERRLLRALSVAEDGPLTQAERMVMVEL